MHASSGSIFALLVLLVAAAGPVGAASEPAPSSLAAPAGESSRYVGYAYELDGSKLLYTENHEVWERGGKPGRHRVVYKDAKGAVLAEKEIDYTPSVLHPDFRLEDVRDGYVEGGKNLDPKRYQLFARKSAAAAVEEGTVEVLPDLVADAGFNQFVRVAWDRLVKGDYVPIDFAVPSQQDHYHFRAGKVGEQTWKGRRSVSFAIEIDSAILRMFLDPIEVTYDLDTRELLEFRGKSNVNDAKGKSYVTRIEFPYGQRPPTADATASATASP